MSTDEDIQDRLARVFAESGIKDRTRVTTGTVAFVDGLEARCVVAGDADAMTPVRLCRGVSPQIGDALVLVGVGARWYGVGSVTGGASPTPPTPQQVYTFTDWLGGRASGKCQAWKRNGVVTVIIDASLRYEVDAWDDVIPAGLVSWLAANGGLPDGGLIAYMQDGWALSMGYSSGSGKTSSLWNTQGYRAAGSYILGNATWAALS